MDDVHVIQSVGRSLGVRKRGKHLLLVMRKKMNSNGVFQQTRKACSDLLVWHP
jgi:hypothetical protein